MLWYDHFRLLGLKVCFLLYIAGFDNIENREIYETYMHFGQISDSGKITPPQHLHVPTVLITTM